MPAAAVAAIRGARAAARATVWGHRSPVRADGPVIVDLDATLVTAHSEKEGATPTFKRGFGFHPLLAFVDHGDGGTGEPLAGMLRPGGRPPTTPPIRSRCSTPRWPNCPNRCALGCWCAATPAPACRSCCWHVHDLGLEYSVGISAANPCWTRWRALPKRLAPRSTRRPAPRGRPSRRADPVDAGHLHRVAARDAHHRPPRTPPSRRAAAHHRRRRLADHRVRHQHRRGRLADLEVRHRLRARAEDRIRGLKDTGLTNLPLQAFTKNQIWLELVRLAAELLTWTQLLACHDQPARTWEPKRLRLRLLAVAGRLITTGRRRILRLSKRWPWTDLITTGHQRLVALA